MITPNGFDSRCDRTKIEMRPSEARTAIAAARARRRGPIRFLFRVLGIVGDGGRRKATGKGRFGVSAFCRPRVNRFCETRPEPADVSSGFVRTIRLTRFRTNRGNRTGECPRAADPTQSSGKGRRRPEPVRRNHIACPERKKMFGNENRPACFSSCSGARKFCRQ